MKKTILLLVSLLITLSSWAYDFSSGGIYYSIISSSSPQTVSVCYAGSNLYSGSVVIPSVVTNNGNDYTVITIGGGAFLSSSGLTSITIPSTVTTIESSAFYGCTGLTSITIPSSVTSIQSAAFQGCSGLTSFSFSSQITSITSGVLMDCTGLTSVTIPSTVTTIVSSAFSGCTKLTSVSIPSSVIALGDMAFMSCSALTSISVNKATPISLSSSASIFVGVNKSTCVLHVPVGSKTLYSAALYWKDFINIVEDLTNPIYNAKGSNIKITTTNGNAIISGLPQGETVSVYNLQGTAIYSKKLTSDEVSVSLPAHGLYIVKVGNESVKVVY